MKNLLALVGLLVVGFGGAGWYFGWYDFSVKTGTDGKVQVSGDVDVKKIQKDAGNFVDKASQALRNANQTPTGTQPPVHPPGLMGPPMPTNTPEKTNTFPITTGVAAPKAK